MGTPGLQQENGASFRSSNPVYRADDMLNQIPVVPNGHHFLAELQDFF